MKSVGLFLLGIVLGVLLHREYIHWRHGDGEDIQTCPAPPAQAVPACDTPASGMPSSGMPAIGAPAAAASSNNGTASTDSIIEPMAPFAGASQPNRTDAAYGLGSLLIPVQGKLPSDLSDTFTDSRSEGRPHEAIDIMAEAGTPVLAVADGHVEKLFTSDKGGLTIYQFEPSGRYAYYYAHLQRYADGLREKQALRKGDVIGYVGSTGNASPAAPHLHFAIFALGPERQWWKGTAINPYPVLRLH
ncbi:M23 family metallopeptidase [Lysobacter hankyongensis]|uniref:M23 family metallopeptidase n=1 Tax=Lysobacter hankyongensis TaxID=1176535 RepID=A0ABP9BY96_9GAMM